MQSKRQRDKRQQAQEQRQRRENEAETESLLQQHRVQYDTSALDTEEHIQREKLKDIREIEGEIGEVAECYRLVNTMVGDQQSGLNAMQTNVQTAEKQMEAGTKEVKKASEYQKKARKRQCCLLFILLLIIGIIVLVFVVLKK